MRSFRNACICKCSVLACLSSRDAGLAAAELTMQIKLAAILASSFVFGCIGFGALHAQTKISPAFWVTETLEVSDQAAFLNVIKAVPATLRLSEGNTSFLAGRLHPGRDRRLVELQLLRSIAWKKRGSGSIVPRPPRHAPKPKSSPKYAASSSKALPSNLADSISMSRAGQKAKSSDRTFLPQADIRRARPIKSCAPRSWRRSAAG